MSNENTTVATVSLAALAAAGNVAELTARLGTQANAARIKALAQGRVDKAQQVLAEDGALVAAIAAIEATLPVGTPSGAKVIPVSVGDTIKFNRKGKAGAVVTEGVVKAIKPAAANTLAQYRVEVGEGFDAELVNVFPGTVIENVTKGGDAQAELPLEGNQEGTPAAPEGVVDGASGDAAVDALLN